MDEELLEPTIHSHLTDSLPDDHPLAFENIYCDICSGKKMLHCENNECMQTWIEWGGHHTCMPCFIRFMQDYENGIVLELSDWQEWLFLATDVKKD